jgi:putative membrane protein (TIGR04086 family)
MGERYSREEVSGTSWASVVFGWLAALGASLILGSIVGAIVVAIFAALGFRGGAEAGSTSLIGLLITFFLSFLVGGYVAGRMARRSGKKHGLLVALLALVITIILALLGVATATPLVNIPGVTFNVPTNLPSDVPGLGIVLSISGLLVLIFIFAGAAIGGQRGARTGRQRL